jgi:hypothetical protein
MMTYKEWNLLPKQELNGITVDYTDPEGQSYSAPFCFHTLEEALNYGKLCIDKSIESRLLQNNVNEAVQKRIIS